MSGRAGRAAWGSLICAGVAVACMAVAGGSRTRPVVALGLNLLALVGLLIAISQMLTGTLFGFAIGALNRYSLARTQMTAWTVLVLAVLLTAIEWNLLQFHDAAALELRVPESVLATLGISYGSGVVAATILAVRESGSAAPRAEQVEAARQRIAILKGSAAGVVARNQVVGNDCAEEAGWTEIFSGDDVPTAGRVDLSKVQQAFLTAILIGTYLCASARMFGDQLIGQLPEFSESLAGLLAVSHAGYLTFKAIPKPDTAAPRPVSDQTTS